MSHVLDDLELHALGALPPDVSGRVARHLGVCASCREANTDLAEVVALLPDAVPLREPSAGLKARILEAARAERAPRPFDLPLWLSRWRPDLRIAAMAAAIAVLVAVDAGQAMQLRALQAERDEYTSLASAFAHGGRTWYMAGVGEWRGSGGNLVQPATGDPAFVVFHGLRDLPSGQTYALWLITPDGKWVRGSSFRSDGSGIQTVRVGLDIAGYDRCAVTVETGDSGTREGSLVMRSAKIVPLTP